MTVKFGSATILLGAITAVSLAPRTEMNGDKPWFDVLVYISGSHFTERFWGSDDGLKRATARKKEIESLLGWPA